MTTEPYPLDVFSHRQLLAIAFAFSILLHLAIWLFGIDTVESITLLALISLALLSLIVHWWSA